jgi:uncharacterized protein (TIGR03067 family)
MSVAVCLVIAAGCGQKFAPDSDKREGEGPTPSGVNTPRNKNAETHDLKGIWSGKKFRVFEKEGDFAGVYDFTENQLETFLDDKNEKCQWRYRTDPTKSPQEIDLTQVDGPFVGKTLKGIYKIDKDVLSICYVRPSVEGAETKARPTEFDTKKRDDVVLLTFERKRK